MRRSPKLREEQRQELRELYPTTSNAVLMNRFNVSRATIQRLARELGLKKDPAYRNEVQRQNATGRVLSDASRETLRRKALGRKMSEETKKKILQTKMERGSLLRGERHPFWKGGRPWERFKDPRYLAWRKAVLERDGCECQQCGRQCKKYERGLAAPHVKPYAAFPELRYEVSNGITLCRQCHMRLHDRLPAPRERIPCACVCGALIDPVDRYGRPRRYVNRHGQRGRKVSDSTKQILREQRAGKTLTPEHGARISAGLRNSTKRNRFPPRSSTEQSRETG